MIKTKKEKQRNISSGFYPIKIKGAKVEEYSDPTFYLELDVDFDGYNIKHRMFYQTEDTETYKRSDWKVSRLFSALKVPPRMVEGDASYYEEKDLIGQEALGFIYRNPETNYLDLFEVTGLEASEKEKDGIVSRFNKFFERKFGSVGSAKEEWEAESTPADKQEDAGF